MAGSNLWGYGSTDRVAELKSTVILKMFKCYIIIIPLPGFLQLHVHRILHPKSINILTDRNSVLSI